MSVRGIGPAKATRILAAVELWRRLSITPQEERPKVYNPTNTTNLLVPEMGQLAEEKARVLYLSIRNDVLGMEAFLPTEWETPPEMVRSVFTPAILLNAGAIIVARNHLQDAGLEPSDKDIMRTRELVKAGQLLDIELLVHLIIHDQHYQLLKQHGIGFE